MQIKIKEILTAVVFYGALAGASEAASITIGQAMYQGNSYNLVYDNSPFGSVVWLNYTNSAMNWQNQMAWAAGLNNNGTLTYGLYAGYKVTWDGDWRLPITTVGNWGYGNTNSEFGHLFYAELGNQAWNYRRYRWFRLRRIHA